jgi:hypothetical protein
MAESWTLVTYQAPASPSTARVAAWRGLHGLGALYLGPSVCVLPSRLADPAALEPIASRVRAGGGTFQMMSVEAFGAESEVYLQQRCNEARAAEYAEIVERAQALVAELAREGAREKFTFAEVEENEADLVRLRQWFRRVAVRDLFGCAARADAEAAVHDAAERLAAFVDEAIGRETERAIGTSDVAAQPHLHIVNGRS